jgi:integrase
LWRSRRRKLAPKTLNEYLAAFSAFLSWLVSVGRAAGNSLSSIQKADTRGRQTVTRRAFNFEELRRLCEIEGRGLVYAFAAFTGLRRAEIKALRWSDLVLDGDVPRVLIRASTAKNRKNAAIPLHSELATALRNFRTTSRDISGLVFSPFPKMPTLNRDLVRCGIKKTDSSGRTVDFHAFRVTFATLLNLAGVSPRVAMGLMRHSDMRLTHNVYTDTTALPYKTEIEKLPHLKIGL